MWGETQRKNKVQLFNATQMFLRQRSKLKSHFHHTFATKQMLIVLKK